MCGTSDGIYVFNSDKWNKIPDLNSVIVTDIIEYRDSIFVTTAVLGGKINVPTLRGEKGITIPPSVEDKKQFILRGEGIESIHGKGKGNQIVQIKIKYPKKLTDEQKELLEKLNESFGYESSPHENKLEELVSKVKKWFS